MLIVQCFKDCGPGTFPCLLELSGYFQNMVGRQPINIQKPGGLGVESRIQLSGGDLWAGGSAPWGRRERTRGE